MSGNFQQQTGYGEGLCLHVFKPSVIIHQCCRR